MALEVAIECLQRMELALQPNKESDPGSPNGDATDFASSVAAQKVRPVANQIAPGFKANESISSSINFGLALLHFSNSQHRFSDAVEHSTANEAVGGSDTERSTLTCVEKVQWLNLQERTTSRAFVSSKGIEHGASYQSTDDLDFQAVAAIHPSRLSSALYLFKLPHSAAGAPLFCAPGGPQIHRGSFRVLINRRGRTPDYDNKSGWWRSAYRTFVWGFNHGKELVLSMQGMSLYERKERGHEVNRSLKFTIVGKAYLSLRRSCTLKQVNSSGSVISTRGSCVRGCELLLVSPPLLAGARVGTSTDLRSISRSCC
nr:squamosa promoter-binding-like protein 14 isoform X2 [Ipomoea batatas]